jgi:hypothetical protein
MAPMTEIGSPRKFGTGRREHGSENIGVICERQRLQRIDQKGNTKKRKPRSVVSARLKYNPEVYDIKVSIIAWRLFLGGLRKTS